MLVRRSISALPIVYLLACAPGPDIRLEPPWHQAHAPGDRDVAIGSAMGVRVAAGQDWPDDVDAPRGTMVPMRVTVRNGSATAIGVAADRFALVDPTGRRYGPIAPDQAASRLTRTGDAEVLLMTALPEGDLAAGDRSDGYLYFEPVVSRTPELTLEVRLARPDGGAPIGPVTLAFRVER
jgi:hypothetical protein